MLDLETLEQKEKMMQDHLDLANNLNEEYTARVSPKALLKRVCRQLSLRTKRRPWLSISPPWRRRLSCRENMQVSGSKQHERRLNQRACSLLPMKKYEHLSKNCQLRTISANAFRTALCSFQKKNTTQSALCSSATNSLAMSRNVNNALRSQSKSSRK